MESRVETLLNAVINGENIDFNPQSRMEEYLKNCINKTGIENLPAPQSRVDALLYRLAEVLATGSGGGNTAVIKPLEITENGVYEAGTEPLKVGSQYTFKSVISGYDSESLMANGVFAESYGAYFLAGFDDYNEMDGWSAGFLYMPSSLSGLSVDAFLVKGMAYATGACPEMGIPSAGWYDMGTATPTTPPTVTIIAEGLIAPDILPQFFDLSNVDGYAPITVNVPTPSTPTDNRTSLENWYQYLGGHNFKTGYIDEENWEEGIIGEPYEELAYPTGTQNVTNANGILSVYIYDELTTGEYTRIELPVKKLTGTLDLRSVEKIQTMFGWNDVLEDVGTIDLRSATSIYSLFQGTPSLTRARLKNLKTSASFNYQANIVVDDLIYTIYHLRNTGSSNTFTMHSQNIAKLANVYVKTIAITDAMRAEDDLIDEKLPFEVCNSTDTGAMLITDYVTLKNWILK